jgi:TolA-binding protein
MKRLSEMDPDGLESQLIRAGQREAPAAAVQQAAAAAGSLALVGSLAPKAIAASIGPKALLLLAAKGMLAGAVVTGAVIAFTAEPKPSTRAAEPARVHVFVPPKAEESPAVSPPLPAVPAEEVPGETARSTQSGPGANSARATSKRSPGPSRGPSAPANSVVTVERPRFADELRAFENAHAAFTRRDLSSAEAGLDEYQRAFPGGALALEAEVLRIELLNARGNTPAVRARASAFLSAHPTAPAARRVRKLLEQSEGTSP